MEEVHVEREAAQIQVVIGVHDLGRQRDLDRRRHVGEGGRVEDERRVVAADVDRVVARATDDRRLELRAGGQHIDLVGPAGAVDLDRLDAGEGDQPSRAGEEVVRDDEDVADRGADQHHRVGSRAAVDEHRRVLEVVVAVRPSAAEEIRQVRHILRVVRILAQHEERLEQEAVVPAAAVQPQLGPVVVDLEAVVLVLAGDEQRRGVAVGHVLGVGHRHAVRELERAVARVRDQRHGADDDLVVPRAEGDDRRRRRVVRQHAVVAAERHHQHALDALEHEQRVRDLAGQHLPGAERAASGGVQRDHVAQRRPAHDQVVDARASAGVVDVDPAPVVQRDGDDVVLEIGVGVVPLVVQHHPAAPRRRRDRLAPDLDHVVRIVDHDRVVARSAGDVGHLEQAVDRLDDGPGREAVADVRGVEVRVLLGLDPVDQVLLGLERAQPVLEVEAARVLQHAPGDEVVVVQRQVEVLDLDQRVDLVLVGLVDQRVAVVVDAVERAGARVTEGVEAVAAGVGVVAPAAVEDVVEWRRDQRVVTQAALELETDEIGEGGRHRWIAVPHRRGVEQVVPTEAPDDQPVPLAAFGVRDQHVVEEHLAGVLVQDADGGHLAVDLVLRGQREAVGGGRVTLDDDRVGGAVVRDGQDRLLGRDPVLVGDELNLPGVDDVLAGVDRQPLDTRAARASQVLDGEGVAAAAAVEHQVLDAAGPERAVAVLARREHLTRGRRGDADLVGLGGHRDDQEVLTAAAGDVRQVAVLEAPADQVVAAIAVERVEPAAAVELVVVRSAVQRVTRRAAEELVHAGVAVERRAAAAVVADVVVARPAAQQRRRAVLADLDVVVVRAAVDDRVARTLVDQDVVPRAAVEHHGDLDAGAHDDLVVAVVGIGHDLLDAVVDLLAAAHDDPDPFARRGAAGDVLDQERLVRRVLGDVPHTGARADVQVQLAVAAVPARPLLPALRIAAALVAREEHRLGQLQVAQVEAHGLGDLDEQDLDLDRRRGGDVDQTPAANGREAEADAHAGEGEAEGADAHLGRGRDPEAEVARLGLVEEGAELELAHKTEGAAPQHELAADEQVEVAARVEPAVRRQRGDAEERHLGAEGEDPLAAGEVLRGLGYPGADRDALFAAHPDHERGVELEDLEDLHLAREVEGEGVGAHPLPRDVRGVQHQHAQGVDLEDLEDVHVERDAERQHEARMGIGVDAGEAEGLDRERAERDLDVEHELEARVRQRELDDTGRRGEGQELDRALDADLEDQVRDDDRRTAAEIHEGLLLARRVELDQRAGLEAEPDPSAEAAHQAGADLEVRHQPLRVDAQVAVEHDLADRADDERRVESDLELRSAHRVRAELNGRARVRGRHDEAEQEVPADQQQVADLEPPAGAEGQAGLQRLRHRRLTDHARHRIDREQRHVAGHRADVDLEHEAGLDRHAGDVAAERQRELGRPPQPVVRRIRRVSEAGGEGDRARHRPEEAHL